MVFIVMQTDKAVKKPEHKSLDSNKPKEYQWNYCPSSNKHEALEMAKREVKMQRLLYTIIYFYFPHSWSQRAVSRLSGWHSWGNNSYLVQAKDAWFQNLQRSFLSRSIWDNSYSIKGVVVMHIHIHFISHRLKSQRKLSLTVSKYRQGKP